MLPSHIFRVQTWKEKYDSRSVSTNVDVDLSRFKYIGLFCKSHSFAISLDIDIKGFSPDKYDIPLPNWVTINPKSGHSHAVWFIDGIVKRNGGSQENYLNAIAHKLASKISETNCTVRINNATQNPLHSHWTTVSYHTSTFDMAFLAESLGLNEKSNARKSGSFKRGLGRNCAVFYDCVGVAMKKLMGRNEVAVMVEKRNLEVASEFGKNPMDANEIKHIINSIVRYVGMAANKEKRNERSASAKKAHNPSPATDRAKYMGMSRASYYAKGLHKLGEAIKHALSLDTPSGIFPVSEGVIEASGAGQVAHSPKAHADEAENPRKQGVIHSRWITLLISCG